MLRDFKAPFAWPLDQIAALSLRHRRLFVGDAIGTFDVTEFFHNALYQARGGKITKLVIKDLIRSTDFPACVKFKETRLIVDDEVWRLASLGDPESRYCVAHEFGHLILHSDYEQHFSDPSRIGPSWVPEIQRTEWQAHAYGRNFLAPDSLVRQAADPAILARVCSIPIKIAEMRFEDISNQQVSGDFCRNCMSFTIIRSSDRSFCEICGVKI